MQQVRIANDKVKAKRNREKWFCIIFIKLVFFWTSSSISLLVSSKPKALRRKQSEVPCLFQRLQVCKSLKYSHEANGWDLPLFLLVCKKITPSHWQFLCYWELNFGTQQRQRVFHSGIYIDSGMHRVQMQDH